MGSRVHTEPPIPRVSGTLCSLQTCKINRRANKNLKTFSAAPWCPEHTRSSVNRIQLKHKLFFGFFQGSLVQKAHEDLSLVEGAAMGQCNNTACSLCRMDAKFLLRNHRIRTPLSIPSSAYILKTTLIGPNSKPLNPQKFNPKPQTPEP